MATFPKISRKARGEKTSAASRRLARERRANDANTMGRVGIMSSAGVFWQGSTEPCGQGSPCQAVCRGADRDNRQTRR